MLVPLEEPRGSRAGRTRTCCFGSGAACVGASFSPALIGKEGEKPGRALAPGGAGAGLLGEVSHLQRSKPCFAMVTLARCHLRP